MIKYTIIIPTCNKDLTEKCLGYISLLSKPKHDYEVLVIHNVSNDDIKSVTDSYKNNIPNLKYIYVEMYGQMSSRHRGAIEAQGEILCYLDDDSFVDKKWLISIEETFENQNVVLASGNNLPLYESKPPKWLKYFWHNNNYGKYMGYLSLINFHNKMMNLPAWYAFGCNYIIKKNVFFEMGGTNPDVVPKDKQRFQGDGETALSLKLNKEGFYLNFNPKIKIHHYVPSSRMILEYFKKRAYYQGVCDSFSKIRKENGSTYYEIKYNKNLNIKRIFPLNRIIKKILNIRKRINKKTYLFFLNRNKNYLYYKYIKSEYEKSYQDGFNFHQNEVKNDPELLKWVLKENFLDI